MKRLILPLISACAFLFMFNACSTDVDLYADYKDITVVYGLLDSGADTNFIKINKAFLGPGNAYDIALIDDSCNYPGKLDAKLIEYRSSTSTNNYQKTAEFPLDTLTVHNKELGLFYAPDQLVYYTTKRIKTNDSQYKYRYELQIDKGDTIVSAVTNIVGGGSFFIPQATMNLSAYTGSISWSPSPYAAIYEVVLKFSFIEVGPNNDSVVRCMTWPLGAHPEHQLTIENNIYTLPFKPNLFFYNMAAFLGNDTLNNNVERLVTDYPLEVSIAAGGDELYNFISVNAPSNSIVQNLPEYTNVSGGYGVLSSRVMLNKRMRISGNTLPDLMKHDHWHFRQAK
ncbi:MAG: DUF4249 family protein [Bacteroidales bacterium]|nr:DUF4249 family protein [Bacteroidales bacterium]